VVPNNLARRNFGLLVSAATMLREAIGPAGRCRGGWPHDRNS
jgi:hypothetical protein